MYATSVLVVMILPVSFAPRILQKLLTVYLEYVVFINVVVLLLSNAFVIICFRNPAMNSKHRRCDAAGVESCVCYVAADSSVQALLADPSTCQRPCDLRERLQSQDAFKDKCGSCENQCLNGSCDECPSYDF